MKHIEITPEDDIYPKRLLKIRNYPKELYVLGNYELLNKQNSVAIVGSRDCTEYGRECATYFSEELSKKDICIISGLAIGIDASAHIGAVENKRKDNSSTWTVDLIKCTQFKMSGCFTKFYKMMVV